VAGKMMHDHFVTTRSARPAAVGRRRIFLAVAIVVVGWLVTRRRAVAGERATAR
jgi:hypothetical protein